MNLRNVFFNFIYKIPLTKLEMNGKSDRKRKRAFNWDDVYQSSSEDERQIIKKRVRKNYQIVINKYIQ